MTGVGYFTAGLVDALPAAAPEDEFIFLALHGQEAAWRPLASTHKNAQWIAVDADPQSHPGGDIWLHYKLPRLLKSLGANLFHGTDYQVPFLRRMAIPSILTIHDLSVFQLPQVYHRL